jgi:hypothetical protein
MNIYTCEACGEKETSSNIQRRFCDDCRKRRASASERKTRKLRREAGACPRCGTDEDASFRFRGHPPVRGVYCAKCNARNAAGQQKWAAQHPEEKRRRMKATQLKRTANGADAAYRKRYKAAHPE